MKITKEDVLKTYKSEFHGKRALHQYEHWFPLRASPRLAGVVADLMEDGHLQDWPKLRLDYTSNSEEELERFNQEIYLLFGIKGKIRDCKSNNYGTKNLGVNNKPLSRLLKIIGVPVGPKVLTSFKIPNWIMENKLLFSKFINRLISCEGCVDKENRYIEIQMSKSMGLQKEGLEFFNQIKQGLEKHFGIISTNPFPGGRYTRKDGTKARMIRLKIKRAKAVILFKEKIGIENPEKKKKLSEVAKKLKESSNIERFK